ncbi:Ribonuclease pancreatic beta-type [Labeo rohita]|uniref:Ribonuclease pancreatic beta-type n=1 Tax=Labeo rohita TaxID=84645 RepID=A0ABQ8L195_LABRO|nr:Ribonuclease pancreatic beta-type [Labeo rohita]
MRLAVLLLLFVPLVYTDGWDFGRFSNDQSDMFPCQRSQNNNAYNNFKHRHILAYDFNTSSRHAWAAYLTRQCLCGRAPLQSFLHKNEQNSIVSICNGRGVRDTGNKCISEGSFNVYTVRSSLEGNGECEVHLRTDRSHVIVACEVVENRCVPVHYETQTNRRPPRDVCQISISDTFVMQTQQGSFICTSSRTAHRMRLAVLLLLFGWDFARFITYQSDMFPCQRSQNNNAYNNFKHRHFLAYDFNTSIHLRTECSHVIVACEVIENHCVPIRYETQTNSRSPRDSVICRPMRLAVLLLLLVPLVFTDGWDFGRFSRAFPCQRSQNNNAYNNFKHDHILTYDFNTSSRHAWAAYLTSNNLCARNCQSFLHKNDTNNIVRICNGEASDTKETSASVREDLRFRNKKCRVRLKTEYSHVIVACEVIENHCVPIRYEAQTNRRPPRDGEICRP